MQTGIVHLGLGAFHRAHQLPFTEDSLLQSGGPWGVCGVTQRSAAVVAQLQPQDGLYCLVERSSGREEIHVVDVITEVLSAVDQPAAVVERLSASATRIISLTVTEKGYRRNAVTGRLDEADPGVQADLSGETAHTVIGQLARGLEARMRSGHGPVTVLCCDNLQGSGRTVASLVEDFCGLMPSSQGARLATWISENVAFPQTMVDRIVPATTDDDRSQVSRQLGLVDEGVVVTEPFRQWVIEDTFADDRPAWELAGATLTSDVGPYESMKIRLLNGSHSLLAYLGALAGHEYISDAMDDPSLAESARRLMDQDVAPTLIIPAAFDLPTYKESLLARFENPKMRHRTLQIAMDGTQKLPARLLATAADRLRAGHEPHWACLGIAAWMRYVSAGVSELGEPISIDDPLAPQIAKLLVHADDPTSVAAQLMKLSEVFGDELSRNETFRALVTEQLALLTSHGVARTLRQLL